MSLSMPYIVSVIINILFSGLPCALLGLGIFLTFRILDFADLTAEGSFLIGGATCITLIKAGVDPYLSTFIALISGGICGIITGLLHTKLKIPKLLSGIITMTACLSLSMAIMGSVSDKGVIFDNIVLLGKEKTIYSTLWPGNVWNQVVTVAVMFVVVVVVWFILYFFFGTEYGMAIRATGMNEKMARANGINTNRAIIICCGLSNALIGLAGALFSQSLGMMSLGSQTGFLVIGLASIILGEAIFGKRNFKNWLISVSLGAIVYFIVVVIALELGFPTELKNLLYAVLIVIALSIPLIRDGITKLIKKKKEVIVHD